jgi:hypothetical protein
MLLECDLIPMAGLSGLALLMGCPLVFPIWHRPSSNDLIPPRREPELRNFGRLTLIVGLLSHRSWLFPSFELTSGAITCRRFAAGATPGIRISARPSGAG